MAKCLQMMLTLLFAHAHEFASYRLTFCCLTSMIREGLSSNCTEVDDFCIDFDFLKSREIVYRDFGLKKSTKWNVLRRNNLVRYSSISTSIQVLEVRLRRTAVSVADGIASCLLHLLAGARLHVDKRRNSIHEINHNTGQFFRQCQV